MRARPVLLAVLLLAAAAPAAKASSSFAVGTGNKPQIAVDSAGTAYVVFNHATGGLTSSVQFCKVPRGAKACSSSLELTADQESFSPPYVFLPAPGVVQIITTRCCYTGPNQTLLFTSTDGGASFGPAQLVGSLDPSGDAILGPGNAISAVTDTVTASTKYQRVPADGSAPVTATSDLTSDEYGGTVGLFNGNPVVAFWDFSSGQPNHVDFSAYRGSGDPNDAASWTPATPVGPGSSTRIASGPSGLFLMYQDGQPGQEHYYVRRYDGSAFGAPVDISGRETGYVNDFFEDPSGRLHAVWRVNPGAVRYTTSTNGTTWSPVVTADDEGSAGGPFALQEAEAGDGQGWVAFDAGAGEGQIRLAPIAPARTTSATVGSDVITLQTPGGCVPPGTITAVLSVRSKKPKGHVVVKIGKVVFSVDGKARKTVTHAPFRAVLTLTGLKPGSTHRLQARAQIRVHHGPPRFKSLVNAFSICG
jgi:hypothetical protein